MSVTARPIISALVLMMLLVSARQAHAQRLVQVNVDFQLGWSRFYETGAIRGPAAGVTVFPTQRFGVSGEVGICGRDICVTVSIDGVVPLVRRDSHRVWLPYAKAGFAKAEFWQGIEVGGGVGWFGQGMGLRFEFVHQGLVRDNYRDAHMEIFRVGVVWN